MLINLVRFVKLTWIISVALFLGVLLYIYAFLPEQVVLNVDNYGFTSDFMSKETLFYLALGIFVLTNLIFLSLSKVFSMMPVKEDSGSSGIFKTESFKNKLILWVTSFLFIINVFYIFSLGFVMMFNHPEDPQSVDYTSILYPGLILLGFWLIILAFLLIRKK